MKGKDGFEVVDEGMVVGRCEFSAGPEFYCHSAACSDPSAFAILVQRMRSECARRGYERGYFHVEASHPPLMRWLYSGLARFEGFAKGGIVMSMKGSKR